MSSFHSLSSHVSLYPHMYPFSIEMKKDCALSVSAKTFKSKKISWRLWQIEWTVTWKRRDLLNWELHNWRNSWQLPIDWWQPRQSWWTVAECRLVYRKRELLNMFEICFILSLLTYAHRSWWSIGHQRPLSIALCSGLLWSFRTSWCCPWVVVNGISWECACLLELLVSSLVRFSNVWSMKWRKYVFVMFHLIPRVLLAHD